MQYLSQRRSKSSRTNNPEPTYVHRKSQQSQNGCFRLHDFVHPVSVTGTRTNLYKYLLARINAHSSHANFKRVSSSQMIVVPALASNDLQRPHSRGHRWLPLICCRPLVVRVPRATIPPSLLPVLPLAVTAATTRRQKRVRCDRRRWS